MKVSKSIRRAWFIENMGNLNGLKTVAEWSEIFGGVFEHSVLDFDGFRDFTRECVNSKKMTLSEFCERMCKCTVKFGG